jgi:hypothetical protein
MPMVVIAATIPAVTAADIRLGDDHGSLTRRARNRPRCRRHLPPALPRWIRLANEWRDDEMWTRLRRLGPLTGVAFALLVFAGMAIAKSPPGASASGARVVAFYHANATQAKAADTLIVAGFAFFLLFAGSLRTYVRATDGAEGVSTVALAGAAVLTAGAGVYFGADFVLAMMPATIAPPAAQALNMLALYLVLPLSAGGLVFGLAAGAAIARRARLPRWLGWAIILIGFALASPALILGILALALWTATASILIWRRTPRTTQNDTVGSLPGYATVDR